MKKVKKTQIEDIFVSVVYLPDAQNIKLIKDIEDMSKVISTHYTNYEIILVENKISPVEVTQITGALTKIPCIRMIRLSRQYSKDICVYVGLESAIGDVVVIRSPSDPVNLLPRIVTNAQKSELVFGVSKTRIRSGNINNYGAKFFYWYNKKFLDISIPENSTYFMALNRKAVNALTRSNRSAKHIRYLARQIGYQSEEFLYTPNVKHIPEKKRILQLAVSAMELSTNYSKHPLRFVAWVGFTASLLNLVYAGYVIIIRVTNGHVAEGWTSLSLQTSGMFFLLFVILAVMCEYIGKILEETWHEPQYHIIDEINSDVTIADATRRNIVR